MRLKGEQKLTSKYVVWGGMSILCQQQRLLLLLLVGLWLVVAANRGVWTNAFV